MMDPTALPTSTRVFTALHDYAAVTPSQMSFKKGDQIHVVVGARQANWYEASLASNPGVRGWVPSNYLGMDPIALPTSIKVYTALYDYDAVNPTQMSFKKGDQINAAVGAMQSTGHEASLVANPEVKGWVPRNYLTLSDAPPQRSAPAPPQCPTLVLPSEEWYHGPCSRYDAEHRLSRQTQGAFLIRDSESRPGDLSLTVMHDGSPVHYRVIKSHLGRLHFYLSSRTFNDLDELVAFHKAHNLPAVGPFYPTACVLTRGLPRRGLLAPGLNLREEQLREQDAANAAATAASEGNRTYSGTDIIAPPPGFMRAFPSRVVASPATKHQAPRDSSGPHRSPPPQPTKVLCKVKLSYTAARQNELTLMVGDIVTILKDEAGGWWKGMLKGKTGLFPSDFVELVDAAGDPPPPLRPPGPQNTHSPQRAFIATASGVLATSSNQGAAVTQQSREQQARIAAEALAAEQAREIERMKMQLAGAGKTEPIQPAQPDVPADTLALHNVIGVGSFKTVYRTTRYTRSGTETVAAMRVRTGDLAAEAKVLMKLGRHPRLVQCLGMCHGFRFSDGGRQDDTLLIAEFAPRGDLHTVVLNMVDATRSIPVPIKLAILQQITSGMEALAGQKLIHRDLALRNVLVFALDVNDIAATSVKITDFGLTVNAYTAGVKIVKGGEIPLRWLPPEALLRVLRKVGHLGVGGTRVGADVRRSHPIPWDHGR